MNRILLFTIASIIILFLPVTASAQYRFPQPEFTNGYEYPPVSLQDPASWMLDYLDVALLFTALVVATFISHRLRKRIYVILLAAFSLLYFGFFREGCFCPIGTLQPVFESLFHPETVIPLSWVFFFVLPILFALYRGRVFCSGVCPLGALQELISIRQIPLPRMLTRFLEMIPPVFLVLSVVSAITGSEYLVCRLDPFVPIFRRSFGITPIAYSLVWLAASVVISRPYCRFFCPYGFLLKLVSKVSKKSLTTSPGKCVDCSLCRKSCPVDALAFPQPPAPVDTAAKNRTRFRLFLFPLFIIAGILWGNLIAPKLAELHPEVRLASYFENPSQDNALEREIFQATQDTLANLQQRRDRVIHEWQMYLMLFGGILGFLLAAKFLFLDSGSGQTEYLPKKDLCLHCLRCVESCPVEHARRTGIPILQTSIPAESHHD